VRRRSFLLAAAVLAASRNVDGQTARIRRIGLLMVHDIFSGQRDEIRSALAERGWIEGRNLHVEARSAAGDASRLPALADELVRLDVDLIVGLATLACLAAKAATSRIPIVMYGAGDPVGSGLVRSLARPGGNVTGASLGGNDSASKRIELIRELVPAGSAVGILVNASNPAAQSAREIEQRTCAALGLRAIHRDVTDGAQLVKAVSEVSHQGGKVIIVPTDPLFAEPLHWERVSSTARQLRLPMITGGSVDVEGVLLSYSVDWTDFNRMVASFVDRILKGANPATLAVEQPSRFSISINLRTAKAARIVVPQSLLLRADRVFE
jgi:putative ABC transport system substrate-binding protein